MRNMKDQNRNNVYPKTNDLVIGKHKFKINIIHVK